MYIDSYGNMHIGGIMFTRVLWLLLLLVTFAFTQGKLTLAVMDLDAEGISASENRIISNRLRTELIQTQKLTVVEREKVEEILTEQGFQLSGCTSNECAVQAGKLLGVKYMAVGSIGKIGRIFTINIRLLNVETGVVMKTAVEDCKCRIDMVLTQAVKKTAEKLAGIYQTNNRIKKAKKQPVYNPEPARQTKQTPANKLPKYNAQKQKRQRSRFFIGLGFGNGRYTLASRLGIRDDVGVQLKPIIEVGLGLRIAGDLWLGYELKTHRFNEVWNGDRYEGKLSMHYPKIQYYLWRWVYFSYGYVFKELAFDRTSTDILSPFSKHFNNDEPMNLLSVGTTIKIWKSIAINLELSAANNYFTAGYDLYLMF